MSFAGEADRADSNRLFIESFFFFFFLPRLWYLVSEPLFIADWENTAGHRWTVPLGGGFGRNFWLSDVSWLALTSRVQAFYNVVRPDNPAAGEISPTWSLRLTVSFFHPNPLVFD